MTLGHPRASRGYGSWLISEGQVISPCFEESGAIWSNLSFGQGNHGGPLINRAGEVVGMVRQRDQTDLDASSCEELLLGYPNWRRAPPDVMTRQLTFVPPMAHPHIDMRTILELVNTWLSEVGETLPENPSYAGPNTQELEPWPTEPSYSGRPPTRVWAELTDDELRAASAVASQTQRATVAVVNDNQVLGAGVLIGPDLVLTSHRVAWTATTRSPGQNRVALYDGTLIDAQLMGDSGGSGPAGATDVALYRLAQSVDPSHLPIVSENTLEERAVLLTVGHPELLLGHGLFTVIAGRYEGHQRGAMMMRLHTTRGNSGGPIVNMAGGLIGIQSGCEPSPPSLMQPMAFLAGPAPLEIHTSVIAWEDCLYQTAAPSSTILDYLVEWGVADEINGR